MAYSSIITNSYVRIDQEPASVGHRVLARTIDSLLLFAYVLLISVLCGIYINLTEKKEIDLVLAIMIVVCFLPALCYSLLWEVFNRGQSPGKKLAGIRVVMRDGSPPSFSAYLLRWVMLIIDLYMSCIGLIPMILTRNNQRFGDLAGGTLVVKENDFRWIQLIFHELRHLTEDYHPIFPQAEHLSLEQMNLIAETLSDKTNKRSQRIHQLALQARSFLKIETTIPDEHFLRTLMRDYQYYTLEEI
ncbi:RDD family protein [Tannerella forsythia]|uniref:RDD family protein n=1 Tax=Tannerella forsythia TaxID=28112 RepID=UPI000618C752|nr:RDD family protein [Tannerella forsythia]BAR48607.1 RDD family protein [Tannerella forsythia 3313]